MAWWKTAKPGDKVVCVDATTRRGNIAPQDRGLKHGVVYTFSEGVFCPSFPEVPCVKVCELDYNWIDARRFRPVQENKKSTEAGVAALRRHLVGKTVEVV